MDKRKEQFNEVIKAFPETTQIKGAVYHLIVPNKNDISLEIKFKQYPKRPKAKLIKNNKYNFKLNRIVSSLREWNEESPLSILELINEIFELIKAIKLNQILIKKELLEGLINICQQNHPHKLTGLLGVKKGVVSEFILPSRACTDANKDFAFIRPTCIIPLDFAYEGTFISRPSGSLLVNEKLNIIFKKRRFTMLLAYPYKLPNCIKCFDSLGNPIEYIVKK